VFVTITKIIRGQDAFSISPFLVIDDNTKLVFIKRCVYPTIANVTPPKCVLGLLWRPQMPITHLEEISLSICIHKCTSVI
jgi:hypothetical protein